MADLKTTAVETLAKPGPSPEELLLGGAKKERRLGQWHATAIGGNGITSSCLYVSGIAIVYAHALAPLALLLAAGVLYLYRKIYTEVVEALPLDGGAYKCLLNCTRKFDASFAACLTLLSYLATAAISAKTAVEYLKDLLPVLPPMETTALVLLLFAGLTILGITDSARVALAIFVLHLATLTLFVVWVASTLKLTTIWGANLAALRQEVHWPKALFLGFSAAMLGVSGFESSANYVEQQRPGVFRLAWTPCLRNWMSPRTDVHGFPHPCPKIFPARPGGSAGFLVIKTVFGFRFNAFEFKSEAQPPAVRTRYNIFFTGGWPLTAGSLDYLGEHPCTNTPRPAGPWKP